MKKNKQFLNLLGDLDELNCHLAMVKALDKQGKSLIKDDISNIQTDIVNICSFVEHPPWDSKVRGLMEEHLENWVSQFGFSSEKIKLLEEKIKNKELNKNFIIPSGNSTLIAQIHISRAVTRRCERVFDEVYSESEYLNVYIIVNTQINNITVYLNVLSDYLFMLSILLELT
jgi:ATP:cob(I)alamin adenosyltransferase